MKKKSKTAIVLVLASLAVFVLMLVFMPEGGLKEKLSTSVTVENGKASPEYSQIVIEIDNSGEYVINPDWYENDRPGFLTGFSVLDESGRCVYSTVGGLLKIESKPLELAAGKYICRIDHLCSADVLETFLTMHPEAGPIPGAAEWFSDGKWEMTYSLRVFEADSGFGDILVIGAGVVLGILLAALIVTLSRDWNTKPGKYDERQIAEQGKSYKLAFYTFLACAAVMIVISDVLTKYVEMRLQLFIVFLIVAAVMLTHSVMHDAYFRMDESRRFYVIFFAFLTVFNIGIGIRHLIAGEAIVDGVFTFLGFANLLCGVLAAYILLLVLIKKLRDREED